MLEKTKAEIGVTRLSKSSPLTDAEAKKLLASVDEVVVAKGKAVRALPAKEATLDDLRGPTGGFRAPIVKAGRRLLVGWNEDELRQTLKT